MDRTKRKLGRSWKSVQIKGRSPRLVVGHPPWPRSHVGARQPGGVKSITGWSPKTHNEWRDLELPFVKTSDKMRKGCLLVAAGQPIEGPRHRWGRCLCGSFALQRGVRRAPYAVRSSMHDSGSLFPRGNLHYLVSSLSIIRPAHMSVAVEFVR